MNRYLTFLGYGTAVGGVLLLILTAGYFFQMPWATSTWPWPDSHLSYIFVSSILAAIAVNFLWLGLIREWGAAVGGALNLCIAFGGMAIFLFELHATSEQPKALPYAVGFALFALSCLGYMLWARRFPIRDTRRMPRVVRVSFWVFVLTLVVVAIALLFRVPTIFPWKLDPRSSVMFGWIFMGAAASFGYASRRPTWHDARGQLLGFLAYDLILIVPYLAHFANVEPEHLTSLTIYTGVLIYSGALAVYYLFIDGTTRTWKTQEGNDTRNRDMVTTV